MRPDDHPPRPALGRSFLTIWAGQTVSEIGSMLAAVGVAIHVFVETGSAAWLGVLSAVAALPFVLAAPLAPLIDRFPRRRVIIGADVAAALGPAVALALAAAGRLEMWHLVAAGFVGGFGTAIQRPATDASVPALVDASALDRANALRQLGPAIGIVAGPVLAAPIVAWWDVRAVLVIDLLTFAVGVSTVIVVSFDDRVDDEPIADDGSWSATWAWLRGGGRPVLALMTISAAVNFVMAFVNVALIAVATDVGGAARAGLVLGAGGAAMVVGSIVAASRGLGPDRIATLVRAIAAMGLGLVILSIRPSLVVIAAGVVVGFTAVPAVNAALSTVYNERTPASMQGRVFALRGSIAQSLQPLGAALAGWVIVWTAGPLRSDGSVASTLEWFVGAGPERASAVVVLGCAVALLAMAAALVTTAAGRGLRAWAMSASADEPGDDRARRGPVPERV